MSPRRPSSKRPSKQQVTWPEALARWETALRAATKADTTVRSYLFEARRLREHLDARGVRDPAQVGLTHLRDYQVGLLTGAASRSGKPNGAATVHRIVTTLRTLFSFLAEEGLVPHDPSTRLEPPRVSRPVPGNTLTPAEVRRLLAAPDRTIPKGLRDRALLEVLYGAGLRRGEALALDLGDLDHHERELWIRQGKGGKGRVLPLIPSAWRQLMSYLERGRPALTSAHPDSGRAVFLSSRGRRVSESSILKLLRTHAATARIPKRLTPHTLRRSFATELHKRGASLRVIQELLGHASLDTTMLYLRVDARLIRREVILHHPREAIDA